MTQKPYLDKVTVTRTYNPDYGDDRICQCGHVYYRHFDSYEDNEPVGCKYCSCRTFTEAALQQEIVKLTKEEIAYRDHIGVCEVDGRIVGIILPVEILSEMNRALYIMQQSALKDSPGFSFILERVNNLVAICAEADAALTETYHRTK